VRGIVCPTTPKIYAQALAEGLIQIFLDAGFCVTNPTCGPCLGMSTGVLAEGEVCASTSNRNFNGRMGRGGMVHLMSPATAAASALAGHIQNSELFQG
jgi:3-isopropylmalate/(R)-2-methylmalate dehydratase large subunit